MKKSESSDQQIAFALKQGQASKPVEGLPSNESAPYLKDLASRSLMMKKRNDESLNRS